MKILKQPTLFDGVEKSTYSPEDSHANHFQPQGKDSEPKTNAICGRKCLERFEKFPHVGSWEKTFAGLLIGRMGWFSNRCLLTWKLKGTKSRRLYFQLLPSTHRTDATEFGLWPTPTKVQRDHPERVIGMLEKGAKSFYSRINGENRPNSILDAAMFYGLLPTPTKRDWKGSRTLTNGKNITTKGQDMGLDLEQTCRIINGIPGGTSKTSQLNPLFVAEMMGFPPNWTISPFQNGENKV